MPERETAAAAPALSSLPSVDRVLASAEGRALLGERGAGAFGREAVLAAVRSALGGLRAGLLSGADVEAERLSPSAVAVAARGLLETASRPRLRRIVNATGVVLHTNLGRATLAAEAIEAVALAASEAVNLEYDVEEGARGSRDALVQEHLCALTGAEAATVVNNNAAAVVLALSALAAGREVVVSRGELVEIGGSFRVPEIMAASGARLREVGTTNRTHPADYRAAIGPDTALLMKVHASNYSIVGFTSAVGIEELAAIAAAHPGVFVVEDLGSGALVDFAGFDGPAAAAMAGEPVVGERIRAGADLVLASGDKLLGGPQCGIVVGRAHLVARLNRHPLKRALRCDKMTLAALEATLRLYRFSARPEEAIPTLRRLLRGVDELRPIGERAVALLSAALGDACEVRLVESHARAGSGSRPDVTLPSLAVELRPRASTAQALERRLRLADPPIVGRIEKEALLLDLRMIDDPSDLVPRGSAPGAHAMTGTA